MPMQVPKWARAFAPPSWDPTTERVAKSVVVIKMNIVRAFEGNETMSSTATGFIVDKERGLILSNRHVVTHGPVVATATLLNKEEVDLMPVYADPVHDFGFYRFDPAKVHFQDLENIPLSPERARVGLDIRVMGNDAGERLAILSGTLARLDRNAPIYNGLYSDQNTFYFAAASNTSGGSSGSPVIDIHGHAVALNAGGMFMTASSYYLPLDRAVRALRLIQAGEPVPRRTIQATFRYRSYASVERLGVDQSTIGLFRKKFPSATGMLAISRIVPEGPAERAGLEVGDVLIRVNDQPVNAFVPLAQVMDESKSVTLVVRRDKEDITVNVDTDDLHELTATEFLELSNGIFHNLSYMQAVALIVPVRGVVVASPGFMFGRAKIPWQSVITSVEDVPTPDLASFQREITRASDLSNVSFSYYLTESKFKSRVGSCRVDRTWFPWQRCVATTTASNIPEKYVREWVYSPLEEPSEEIRKNKESGSSSSKSSTARTVKVADDELPMICFVSFDAPISVCGIIGSQWSGTALIVDSSQGLVVCDRSVIPHTVGNAYVTLGGIVKLPAKVVFIHPLNNLAILQYDSSKVIFECPPGVVPEAQLSPKVLQPGDATRYIGLTSEQLLVKQKGTVTLVKHMKPGDVMGDMDEDCNLGQPGDFDLSEASNMIINQTVVQLDNVWHTSGGVLVDEDDKVQAFWFNFSGVGAGVPAEQVLDTVDRVRSGFRDIYSLALELTDVSIATAVDSFGLSEKWATTFAKGGVRHAISVSGVLRGSKSSDLVEEGDLLLSVNKVPATSFAAVENAAQDAGDGGVTKVVLLRKRQELELEVPVTTLSARGVERVIVFAGMILQKPPVGIGFTGYIPSYCNGNLDQTVYCSNIVDGSPATMHGATPERFIESINGMPISSLDDVLEASAMCPMSEFIRIQSVSPLGPTVITVKPDFTFYPTFQVLHDTASSTWKSSLHVTQANKA